MGNRKLKEKKRNIKIAYVFIIIFIIILVGAKDGLKNEYFEDTWLKTSGITLSIDYETKGSPNRAGINNIKQVSKITYEYFVDEIRYLSFNHSKEA